MLRSSGQEGFEFGGVISPLLRKSAYLCIILPSFQFQDNRACDEYGGICSHDNANNQGKGMDHFSTEEQHEEMTVRERTSFMLPLNTLVRGSLSFLCSFSLIASLSCDWYRIDCRRGYAGGARAETDESIARPTT